MIDKIIDAVANALHTEYATYKIYTERVKQGLIEPCFYISVIDSTRKRVHTNRYLENNNFDILYFPLKSENNSEMQSVANELYHVCEFISIDDDKFKGFDMKHQVIDGVLHFFVSYNLYLTKALTVDDVEYSENMEDLTYNIGVESGE